MPSLNRTVAVGLLALLLGFGLRGACRPPQPVEPVAVARSDSLDATKPDYARERDSLALVVQHATDAARRAKREADRLRARAVPNSGTNAPKEGISDTLSDTLVARWRFDTLAAAYDSLAVAYQRTDSARVADSTRADRAEARLAVSEAVRVPLAQAVKRASECRFLGVRTGFCLRFAVVAGPGAVVTPSGRVYGGVGLMAGLKLGL